MRKLGQKAAAIEAYERGVSLYAVEGFIARAIALAKLVVDLDPSRTDVLEKVDPKVARRRRQGDARRAHQWDDRYAADDRLRP